MLDGILWSDLNATEKRAIAMLRDGVASEFCDPVTLKWLRTMGLITGTRLTREGERLLNASSLQNIAA